MAKLQKKSQSYDEFVEKFKPKLTTDDCYTPPEIYEAIKDWAVKEYGLDGKNIVRPFYPGGDYVNFGYGIDDVVIDNPPFSILSKIIDFYIERNIPFFLFAPSLTIFSTKQNREVTAVVMNVAIIYENGANIGTSFLTNLEPTCIRTSVELQAIIKNHFTKVELSKYSYPAELITVNALQKSYKYNKDIRIPANKSRFVRVLDAQKPLKKAIYGGGFLVSSDAAKVFSGLVSESEEPQYFELSERERLIIETLNNGV